MTGQQSPYSLRDHDGAAICRGSDRSLRYSDMNGFVNAKLGERICSAIMVAEAGCQARLILIEYLRCTLPSLMSWHGLFLNHHASPPRLLLGFYSLILCHSPG